MQGALRAAGVFCYEPGPMSEELEVRLQEAEQSLDEGDPEGALETADEVLGMLPKCADAWYLRGLALLDLEHPAPARKAIETAVSLDPELAAAAYSLADLMLYDDGDPAGTLAVCDTYLRTELADELYADFLNLKASALCEVGEFGSALPVYQRAGQLCPDREDAGGMGWCHFELFDFERAEQALLAAVKAGGRDNPATHHYLAVTLERNGQQRRAKKHFRIAARLDGASWFVPVQTPDDEFAQLVEEALDGLSPELKEVLDNVAVVVEPWPAKAELEGSGLSPLIVGLFSGPSRDQRNTEDPWSHMPAQISVYQRNLEYTCPSKAEMLEQIRVTLWHEIGHWLGLSEEELHDRGLG